jgi:hypothetical protein
MSFLLSSEYSDIGGYYLTHATCFGVNDCSELMATCQG